MRRVIRALGPENDIVVLVFDVAGNGEIHLHVNKPDSILTHDVVEKVRQTLSDVRAESLRGVRWDIM